MTARPPDGPAFPPTTELLDGLAGPPEPGDLLAAVQLEWDAAEAVDAPAPPDLPKPWLPTTCTSPGLRAELATWLDDFVRWLNDQHAWDPDDLVPTCWPRHPHLVHDLAVLADQHRRATNDTTSVALDQWHRVLLPAFHDRRRRTVRQHCLVGHRRVAQTP